jgi:dTDP-4-dehydrorhamnose reductase
MILVFGSGGQVGSEVMALAAARGIPASGLSHREADIADAAAVAQAIDHAQPDFVVNCAAYNQVDRAESDAPAAIRTNVDGPAVLARETARYRIPLLHFSTDYVFSGDKLGAWT